MTERFLAIIFLFSSTHFGFSQNELDDSELLSEYDSTELTDLINYYLYIDSIEQTLHYDSVGTISILDGMATLKIPSEYYYLNAKDAKSVLEDAWDNIPSNETRGMLISKHGLLSDSTIAITIELSNEGHVSDQDAESINYTELLAKMQSALIEQNLQRKSDGFDRVTLVGWASPPFYDNVEKKLHWAKEANFSSQEFNTLNYDIRILGRESTIDLTFVTGMDQLEYVKSHVEEIVYGVNFTEGNRYSDYNSKTDRTAEYGIAGLVAGGLVYKAVKIGFLAKFWKLILIGGGALLVSIRKLFRWKK